jgi:flagellar basal-body rod modification protein FlgD
MSTISQQQVTESLMNIGTSSAYSSKTTGSQDLGKDAFLKLLVTQLQHQDPLNPMESVEFTGQLAQFSSLEQLTSLNESFSGISSALMAQNNYQAINLVGKDVKALGDTLSVIDGSSTKGLYTLEEVAADVKVHIYDENGTLVRTMELGSQAEGDHDVEWDGLDQRGRSIPDGDYTYEVSAQDSEGSTVAVAQQISGRVTGVTFDQYGTPWLILNTIKINLGNVIEIMGPGYSSEVAGS